MPNKLFGKRTKKKVFPTNNERKRKLRMQFEHHTNVPLRDINKAKTINELNKIDRQRKSDFDDGFIGHSASTTIKNAIEKRKNQLKRTKRKK